MTAEMPVLIILLVIGAVIAGIAVERLRSKKRRDAWLERNRWLPASERDPLEPSSGAWYREKRIS